MKKRRFLHVQILLITGLASIATSCTKINEIFVQNEDVTNEENEGYSEEVLLPNVSKASENDENAEEDSSSSVSERKDDKVEPTEEKDGQEDPNQDLEPDENEQETSPIWG